jgi:ABC-type amino acid transport substrate-binding protein
MPLRRQALGLLLALALPATATAAAGASSTSLPTTAATSATREKPAMAAAAVVPAGTKGRPEAAATATAMPTPILLRVGVLDGSPPCSDQLSSGRWQGRALDLWEAIASREQLPFLLRSYPSAQALLEATRRDEIDVGVGCLTIAPERLGIYRFSLPFQEAGLAVLLPTDRLGAGRAMLQAVLSPQLLRVVLGYLLVIALLSALVWWDEHRHDSPGDWRGQLRRYALVFQVLASGPGTNVIVTRTRGHGLVLLSWLVRIIGASLIVSTITLEVLQNPSARGSQPRSLADLAGLHIGVRPGSISARWLEDAPAEHRITAVPLPDLSKGPALLLGGGLDALLADEQQLRWIRQQATARERLRLQLAMEGSRKESQAFSLSPRLEPALVLRIDRAISQAKRDGLLP